MKFCVRKRKKFEESAAPPSPGDNVVLEVEVGDEVDIRKQDAGNRSPLDELKRIAEGRGELQLRRCPDKPPGAICCALGLNEDCGILRSYVPNPNAKRPSDKSKLLFHHHTYSCSCHFDSFWLH